MARFYIYRKITSKNISLPPYDELGGGGIAFVTSSNTRTRLNCFTCWSLPTFCTFLAKGAFTRTPDSWPFCITIIKGVAVIRFESKFFDRISKWISSKLDLDGKEKKKIGKILENIGFKHKNSYWYMKYNNCEK